MCHESYYGRPRSYTDSSAPDAVVFGLTSAPNETNPRYLLAHSYKFLVLDEEARAWGRRLLFGRTVEWANESLRVAPDNKLAYWHLTESLLGIAALKSDNPEPYRERLGTTVNNLQQRLFDGDQTWALPWDLAVIYASRGNSEMALEWLGHAYNQGFRFVRWLPIDPAFDDLQDDPRFQHFIDKMEVEVAEMRSNVIAMETN